MTKKILNNYKFEKEIVCKILSILILRTIRICICNLSVNVFIFFIILSKKESTQKAILGNTQEGCIYCRPSCSTFKQSLV